MSQVERQTISAINQTRNKLAALQPGDHETIIQAGADLESALAEIPETYAEAANAVTLCLHALQAIYQEQTADFAATVKALLGALIASEQSLGAPPNPISELMLKQAETSLQKELDKFAASETIEENPAPKLETLDDVAACLMQLELDDKTALETVCDALKRISVAEPNAAKRKIIVKAARELSKIVSGKAADAQETFNTVGELIDSVNSREEESISANENSQTEQIETIESAPEVVEEITPVESKVEEPAKVVEVEKVEQKSIEKAARKTVENETLEVYEPDVLPVDSDMSLVSEFVVESNEMLEAAEGALLALETEPENIEKVDTIFRAFHTVKGSAAYLGLKRLTELAHHAESLLSRMRDREIQCAGGYANLALRSLDMLKAMLSAIEGSSVGTPMNLPASYAELMKILKNPEAAGVSGEADSQSAATIQTIAAAENKAAETQSISVEKIIEDDLPSVINDKTGTFQNKAVSSDDAKKTQTVDSSVRVRTDRLDRLIDIVGELVIAQSMLAQDSTVVQGTYHELTRKISHAGKIVRELQDLSMGMRMIPLKTTFQKMARLVRDVSKKCGKQVEFETIGEDTEIDRNMVDFIADPLVHMVRNAVDHGIETPDKRTAAGKIATGKVKLSAFHAGGDVVVELTDDGAGLDKEKLVAKAIAKNLIESDKGMSENEIYRLIFAPGFSTADEITDVSGRGVGMDVVRRNIESLRGRVEITSEKGKGSIFTIRLPLTLAITDGMLVSVGSERYIVPTVNIHLSFQPNQKMLSSVTGRGELVSLRGELMPVFRLHQLFEVKGAIEDPTKGLLMIVADGRRRCALLVDELLGQQQVVTKTLGQGVGKIQGVSGGAILGDGCVGLILDTAEIVATARQNTSTSWRKDEPQLLAA